MTSFAEQLKNALSNTQGGKMGFQEKITNKKVDVRPIPKALPVRKGGK